MKCFDILFTSIYSTLICSFYHISHTLAPHAHYFPVNQGTSGRNPLSAALAAAAQAIGGLAAVSAWHILLSPLLSSPGLSLLCLSYPVLSCLLLSCPLLSPSLSTLSVLLSKHLCLVLSCLVLSCLVLSCLVLSCLYIEYESVEHPHCRILTWFLQI